MSEEQGSGDRLERREARRRVVRRQRALAVGALVSIAAALLLLALGSGGDGDDGAPGAQTKPAKPRPERPENVGPDRTGWKPHPGPVPFLMYHVIGDPQPGAAFPELYVTVADFQAQMEWLDRRGYQAVTQATIEEGWREGTPVPPKPVVLTFDDGYLGHYTDALPILRRRGWVGTLNLKAQGSDLSDRQVRRMLAAGWELASHTIDHLDLTSLDETALKREVAQSRAQLRRRFGVPIQSFCYPAGRYDNAVAAAVRAAGYRSATTTDPGLASKDEPFTLKRIRISRDMGLSGFTSTLSSHLSS